MELEFYIVNFEVDIAETLLLKEKINVELKKRNSTRKIDKTESGGTRRSMEGGRNWMCGILDIITDIFTK